MLYQFKLVTHNGVQAERMNVYLPVEPYNDLFSKMTDLQMADFKQKLEKLRDVLRAVEDQEVAPEIACEQLQSQFDEFPVPEISETGQRRRPAIVSSNASA